MNTTNSQSIITGNFDEFADLNTSASTQGLAAFLEFFSENVKRGSENAYLNKVLAMLNLELGHVCLDAGCGIGRDVQDFAGLVGATGKIFGIDKSEQFIAKAKELLAEHVTNVDLRTAEITHMPFEDSFFDRIYCERVLQYLPNPSEAFTEFVRTLKPRGKVVVFDSDWDTAAINHPDKKLTREILHALTDTLFPSGQIGRQLSQLATDAGLVNVYSEAKMLTHTYNSAQYVLLQPIKSLGEKGVIATEILDNWFKELEELVAKGGFFAALAGVAMQAEKQS